jgi:hypothetical protein
MSIAKIYSLSSVLATLSCVALLVSCGPKEADKVGEAQLCIDSAKQGEAAACLEKIEGIESAAANTLRCSAGFIDEGFTQPARFKSAFEQLSNGSGSATEGFLSVLSFQSKATSDLNLQSATETYGYCVKSGAKGFMLLGSMANTATNLAKFAGSITPDATSITNAINDLVADPTNPANAPVVAAIGAAISTTYAASCQTGQKADTSLCEQLDSALAGKNLADNSAIGLLVLDYWKNH